MGGGRCVADDIENQGVSRIKAKRVGESRRKVNSRAGDAFEEGDQ